MWEEGTTCLWCHLERSKAMARDSELLERPILGGRFTVGLRMGGSRVTTRITWVGRAMVD